MIYVIAEWPRKLYSPLPVYVFHLPNSTMEMDDWGEIWFIIYSCSEIWIVKDDLFRPVIECIFHLNKEGGKEDVSAMCMSHSLIFLGCNTTVKGLEKRIRIPLLHSQSPCMLTTLLHQAFAWVQHLRCTASHLHPDDVRHPADLRLLRLAAEVPEDGKAPSHQSLICTSLFSHSFLPSDRTGRVSALDTVSSEGTVHRSL